MKILPIVLGLSLLTFACKEETKTIEDPAIETTVAVITNEYPATISAVFDAHGGLDTWNTMNNLCYTMEGRSGKETHTVSLQDRKSKIETEKWSIGYDGSDVWLLQNEADAYKGNARFYHNLMFYFYAMPFVTGDDGIMYTEMEPTQLVGTTYNATKIGYKSGVGDSPDDEYIVYSNPKTNKMEWLGYTVTYGKDGKSTDFHYIKYADWINVNGLVLPKKLTWYNAEDGIPTTERNSMEFDNTTITETSLASAVFKKPETATIAEK